MPLSDYQVKKTFGDFRYKEGRGGRITPDYTWSFGSITSTKEAIRFRKHLIACHYLIKYQLEQALKEASKHIKTYDGCYVPRHILWDAKRGLSRHSWGIAIDLNASTNGYGTKGNQHPELIKIFTKWGFEWGGLWKTRDDMHFECVKIILEQKEIVLDKSPYKVRRKDNKIHLYSSHSLEACKTYALGTVTKNAKAEPDIQIELVNPDGTVWATFDTAQAKLYLGCV